MHDAASNELIRIVMGAMSLAFAASLFVSYAGALFDRALTIWLCVFFGVLLLSFPSPR